MNCRTFREQLADFVAGELDAEQRARAQEHVQACERCRKLVRGLEAAAAVVEADVVSPEEAERQTAALAPPAPAALDSAVWRYRFPTLVRYAAVILLAFICGYLARGWPAGEVAAPLTSDDRASLVSSEFAQRYATVTEQFPDAPTFGRSLLVIARR